MDDWPESAMLLDVSSGEAGEFDRATRADGSSGARLPWPLGKLPAGARQAKNSAGDARYKGLCPPGDDDLHRYGFTVYALGKQLAADDGTGTGDALTAIREGR
jgi:phosphatidylethanolamine-binding protein (PEBP) family uncharacterized protein